MKETHVILYHGGAEEFTTEDKTDKITEALAHGLKGVVREDGGWMAFSSIANIVSLKKYYEMFPAKNVVTKYDFAQLHSPTPSTENGRKLMLAGLWRYIKNHPPANTAQVQFAELVARFGFTSSQETEIKNTNVLQSTCRGIGDCSLYE